MKPLLSLAAALLLSAVLVAPEIAAAAGEESPAPPPPPSQDKSTKGTQTKKPKTDKSSSADDFLRGYHAAYALIYDEADYVGGIAALRALGYDDHPDVATLIGYASRKLGRYDDAKIWYERALAGRSQPCSDLVVLRHVARRTGQRPQGQGRSGKGAPDLRQHRLPPLPMLKEVIDGTATY